MGRGSGLVVLYLGGFSDVMFEGCRGFIFFFGREKIFVWKEGNEVLSRYSILGWEAIRYL